MDRSPAVEASVQWGSGGGSGPVGSPRSGSGTAQAMSPKASTRAVVAELLDRHGRTFADEAGVPVRNTPSPLFRLLCMALLMSARIDASVAAAATRALADEGWTTPDKLAASTWEQRARTLNESGYARYDERTSTMLGETTDLLLERYGGDLRRLRDEAGGEVAELRRRLGEFKGIGEVGVDIFLREVQGVWDEVRPYADERVLDTARRLGLGRAATSLERLVEDDQLPRLCAALVRVDLEGDHGAVLAAAGGR